MIGYLDLKDVLAEIFQDNNCICEEDISNLKGRKLGISFYEIVSDLVLDIVKQGSWDKALAEIKKKFEYHDIDTLFVLPGTNISMGKDIQYAFWRIKHEWWKMELFKNLYENTKHKQIDKFKTAIQEISEIYLYDGFTGYFVFHHIRSYLVKTFKSFTKDSIVAPQIVGTQLAWLYDNAIVDAVMGNPTYFIYNTIDQIISNINHTKKKFSFYDLNKFAQALNLSVAQARMIILAVYIKFTLDKELSASPKFLSASRDRVLEFKKNYRLEIDKRKKVIYDVIEKMRPVITGTETSMQLTKIIATTLDLHKTDVANCYNMLMKSPVMTSEGELIIYPEKRSLSKTFILDTSCRELVCFYSMGYIDDDIFYLMNKTTDHTYSLSPPRADSMESDYCLTNFYVPVLQKALFKVFKVFNKSTIKLEDIIFQLRLQNGNPMPLHVEPEDIRLYTLYTAKSHNSISFYNCLNEFCSVLVKNEFPQEINHDLSLSENELLFYVHLSLLDELKYINLKESKVLVLGASFVKGGLSKFEDQTLLFFELLKLGLIKGQKLHPSNIENINKLTIQDLSVNNSSSRDSYELDKNSDKSDLTQIQKEFYQALRYFEELHAFQRSLTLYQIESNIDKVFETLKDIKNQLKYDNVENFQSLCSILDEAVSKNIHMITLISKLVILGEFKYINSQKLTDYETQQFDQCLKVVSNTFYRKLAVDLVYVFLSTNTRHDLSVLDKAFSRLPFNNIGSPEVAALIKIIFTKFVVYKALEPYKVPYKLALGEQIKRSVIEDSLNNEFDLTAALNDRIEFFDYLLQTCSYKQDAFKEVIENLTEAKLFLEHYITNS